MSCESFDQFDQLHIPNLIKSLIKSKNWHEVFEEIEEPAYMQSQPLNDFLDSDYSRNVGKQVEVLLSSLEQSNDSKAFVSQAEEVIEVLRKNLSRTTDVVYLLELTSKFQLCKTIGELQQAIIPFIVENCLNNYLFCEKLPFEYALLVKTRTPVSSLWIKFLREHVGNVTPQLLLAAKKGAESLSNYVLKLESGQNVCFLNAYQKTAIYRNYFLTFLNKNFTHLNLEDGSLTEPIRQLLATTRLFYSYEEFQKGLQDGNLWDRYFQAGTREEDIFQSSEHQLLRMQKSPTVDIVMSDEIILGKIETSYSNLMPLLSFSPYLHRSFSEVVGLDSFGIDKEEKQINYFAIDENTRIRAKKHCRSFFSYCPKYLYLYFLELLQVGWKCNLYSGVKKQELSSENMRDLSEFMKALLFFYAIANKWMYKNAHLADKNVKLYGWDLNNLFKAFFFEIKYNKYWELEYLADEI